MFQLVLAAVLLAVTLANPVFRPRSDGRIVGGIDASIRDFPYQVAIEYNNAQFCGGSIISRRIVLTAAHCTAGASHEELRVRYGTQLVNKGGGLLGLEKMYEHHDYNPLTFDNDVTVIRLWSGIVFSRSSRSIPLAVAGTAEGGRTGVVTGWGAVDNAGTRPNRLKQVDVNEVDRALCATAYRPIGPITDNMLCFSDTGKDSCGGDSGGPLVVNNVQIGVVSFGAACASATHPGVYANVAALRGFIDMQI